MKALLCGYLLIFMACFATTLLALDPPATRFSSLSYIPNVLQVRSLNVDYHVSLMGSLFHTCVWVVWLMSTCYVIVKGTWGLDPSNAAYIGPEAEFIPTGDYCKSPCLENLRWVQREMHWGTNDNNNAVDAPSNLPYIPVFYNCWVLSCILEFTRLAHFL